VEGCLACDLAEGRLPLPGGRIAETAHWLVDHTVGPLSLGTLILRPKRHVLHVWELEPEESAELGPFLARISQALERLMKPEQIYVTLWSHAGGEPVHIHWVVQPVTRATMDAFDGMYGPNLQVAMFTRKVFPSHDEIEALAAEIRRALSGPARPAT
jgi:diadenosine tetraphosphate (Ap4A) HIT family hydrolase